MSAETDWKAPEYQEPKHVSRLLFPFVLDYVTYGTAMQFISVSTFFPMFVRSLTDSNIIIGLLPAIQMLGGAVPAIIASRGMEHKPRLCPDMMLAMVFERVPLLLMGLWVLLAKDVSTSLLLVVSLLLWAIYAHGGGYATALWTNLVGRTIPPRARGRMAGLGGGLSSALGIFCPALVGWLIARHGLQHGYGLSLVIGGAIVVVGGLVFFWVRETPRVQGAPPPPMGAYLRGLLALLGEDTRFRWHIVGRALWVIGASASAFYTVYAISVYGADATAVTWMTVALAAGRALGSWLGGSLADRTGNVAALVVSSLVLCVAPIVAVLGGGMVALTIVFAIQGIGTAIGFLSGMSIPLELAPSEEQTPRYVAVTTATIGPVATLAPILAGVAIGWIGYRAYFTFAAVVFLLAAAVFRLRVPEPRTA